ncbi:MAG: hypothetical protein KGJ07_06970 [Patescibacteria group bacterium]|nr:hypothetical protein [Patescibacteria group bacterium]MDE2588536.1 hypothetical protein [Patescibacteria group bacterium]
MSLSPHIKPYPKLFKYLPISEHGFTTFATKTIYLSKDIIADLEKHNPNPFSLAVLRHQEIHAHNPSLLKTLRYIVFRDIRVKEETRAYTEMFQILKQHNQTVDLDNIAKQLAGIHYIWMMSYDEGKKFIKRIWDNS